MRVQVVDDNATLRAVACLEVEMSDDLELAGQAADGAEALVVAEQEQPDAIVLDLNMPGMSGMDALPRLAAIVPKATIVIYTSHDSQYARREAARRGASAYVVKGASPITDVLAYLRSRRPEDAPDPT